MSRRLAPFCPSSPRHVADFAMTCSHLDRALRRHARLGRVDDRRPHKASVLFRSPCPLPARFLNLVSCLGCFNDLGLTTNAIVMIGYAVGNAAGPQYWEAKYQPRNHIPWLILSVCWAVSALILLAIRFFLAYENAKREKEPLDSTYDSVYIKETLADGTVVEKKVDRVRLRVGCMLYARWRSAKAHIYAPARPSWTSQTSKTASSDTSCDLLATPPRAAISLLLLGRRAYERPTWSWPWVDEREERRVTTCTTPVRLLFRLPSLCLLC